MAFLLAFGLIFMYNQNAFIIFSQRRKQEMLKRASAIILVLVMIIGLLPILPASTTAFAAESGECGDNIIWTLGDTGTLTITGYGDMYNYSGGEETPWGAQRDSIKKVVFENTGSGIKSIGNEAFNGCSYLTDVTVPPTLKKVGSYAFYTCGKLKDISLPESVVSIGAYAFAYCRSLTKVPSDSRLKNVTYLGDSAFNYCEGITEAVFPPSLKEIPDYLYYGCKSLTEVIIPENVTTINDVAFAGCSSLRLVVLNTGVTELGASVFSRCTSLEYVVISNPLKIDSYAFDYCPAETEFIVETSESDFIYNSEIDERNDVFNNASISYGSTYSVILHPNGGTGGIFGAVGMPVVIIRDKGETFTFFAYNSFIPVGEYDFLGWNTKLNGRGETYYPGDEYTENKTMNFYAQWDEPNTKEFVTRLSGSSRNGTAVAISNEVEESMSTCEAVVLANGWNFADALAGGPLAYALDAPILLITGDDNDAETYAEIERLGVNDIYILGGKGAVSEDVDAKLKKDGYNVERIAGDNRFETAVKIAEKMDSLYSYLYRYSAFYAYSHNYPDALAVSGIAASMGASILYVDSDGVLDPATEAYIKNVEFPKNYIIGGTGAISSAAEDNIRNAGGTDVFRISGATRYETCLEINKEFAGRVSGNSICVSTGINFPDALAGGVLAACKQAPMLLVAPDEPLSEEQKSYIEGFIEDIMLDKVYIFGGKVAIPEAIENELKTLVA